MKALKLGTIVTDTISNVPGMLTHLMINMTGNREYLFQPKSINPKTMKPASVIFVDEGRISGGEFIDIQPPVDILGTKAEDVATGFKGKITGLTYHINGCLHVDVKPEGISEETGSTIEACDFDIRRLKGPALKKLTEEDLQLSRVQTPSPEPVLYKRR